MLWAREGKRRGRGQITAGTGLTYLLSPHTGSLLKSLPQCLSKNEPVLAFNLFADLGNLNERPFSEDKARAVLSG